MVLALTALTRTLTPVLLLVPLACQPTGETPDDATEKLEQRLAAIEAKLDSIDDRLDRSRVAIEPLLSWATQSKEHDAAREARRLEREQKMDARRARRDAQSHDPPLRGPTSRAIEGAAEGIQCTGFESPRVECRIDRALVDELVDNPALLAKQARIVPHQRDGVTVGYKFYGIRRDTLPKLLGIHNGDTLTGVDGDPIDSIDDAMALYSTLRKAKRFELDMQRKGSPYSLKIVIEE